MAPETRFVVVTLCTAMTVILAAGTLNVRVDPLMQYRVPSYPPRFNDGDARFIDAGLAKNLDYDAVIAGSSYVQNFRNADFDSSFHTRTVNLAMSGMRLAEGRKILDLVFSVKNPRLVFMGLDYFALEESANLQDIPDYLYDASLLNDGPYLLNVDTTKRSLSILLHRPEAGAHSDWGAPWWWARDPGAFSRQNALDDYFRKASSVTLRKQNPSLDEMQASTLRYLVPLFTSHTQTTFHVFLPPYSALNWMLYVNTGEMGAALKLRTFLAQTMDQHPNVRLHDFQSVRSVVCNLDRYKDVAHYDPAVNELIVDWMADGSRVTTGASMAERNQALSDIVQDRCGGTLPR